MLIKGNFAQLNEMADQIVATVGRVQTEMDTFTTESGATLADWADRAGEGHQEISAALKQVSESQQLMLEALRLGVQQAAVEYQQALQAALARVVSTVI